MRWHKRKLNQSLCLLINKYCRISTIKISTKCVQSVSSRKERISTISDDHQCKNDPNPIACSTAKVRPAMGGPAKPRFFTKPMLCSWISEQSYSAYYLYSNISISSDVRSISRWGQRRKNVPHHCPRVWAQSHIISYNHISSFCLVTDPASERLQVKSLRHAPRTCSGSTTLTSNKRWTIEPVSHIVPWS